MPGEVLPARLVGMRTIIPCEDALKKTEFVIKSNEHNNKSKNSKEKSIMFIRDLKDCAEFVAGDNSILREILHPEKADLKLRYSLAHATVRPGQTTKPHRLKTSEVYYIMEGEAVMHVNSETRVVRPGSTIYIPPKATQFIRNAGRTEVVFLCIVDPAWRQENEEVL